MKIFAVARGIGKLPEQLDGDLSRCPLYSIQKTLYDLLSFLQKLCLT